MKGLIVVGIIVGIIATAAVLIWLVVMAVRYFSKDRKRVRWDRAEANAKWEEFVDYRAGQIYVGICQVARVGHQRKQLREEIMPGFPSAAPNEIDVELGLLEARRRLGLLNK